MNPQSRCTINNPSAVKNMLVEIGWNVSRKVNQSLHTQSVDERSTVVFESQEDTIYQIDRDVEIPIISGIENEAEKLGGVVLIGEGISENDSIVLPRGMSEEQAQLRVLMDPIDGTRNIMYDKRSAFFLAGCAPNKLEQTTLEDIEIGVMVEIPTSRAYLCDVVWAIRGRGVYRTTKNTWDGSEKSAEITPTKSQSIYGGFAQISRFFPPGRELLSQIEEEMIETLFPDAPHSRAIVFNDQFIASGGQLYELLMGHDRFVADIRASLYQKRQREGKSAGLTCHPYDVSAHVIGTEAGLIITDIKGEPLRYPMDVNSDVDWIAYANPGIRKEVEPIFQKLLHQYELI